MAVSSTSSILVPATLFLSLLFSLPFLLVRPWASLEEDGDSLPSITNPHISLLRTRASSTPLLSAASVVKPGNFQEHSSTVSASFLSAIKRVLPDRQTDILQSSDISPASHLSPLMSNAVCGMFLKCFKNMSHLVSNAVCGSRILLPQASRRKLLSIPGDTEQEAEHAEVPPSGVASLGRLKSRGLLEWRPSPKSPLAHWPSHVFGPGIRGPWMDGYTPLSMQAADSCKAVARADPLVHPTPLILGSALKGPELEWLRNGSMTSVAGGRMPRVRALVWYPRHGLGNTLLGLPVALAYALFSRRRLLRYTWGTHKRVFMTLCDAFECGVDEVGDVGDPTEYMKKLDYIEGERWASVLEDRQPWWMWQAVFVRGSPWWHNHTLLQCLADTLACPSTTGSKSLIGPYTSSTSSSSNSSSSPYSTSTGLSWCLQSNALQVLLRRPSAALNDVIEQGVEIATEFLPEHLQASQPKAEEQPPDSTVARRLEEGLPLVEGPGLTPQQPPQQQQQQQTQESESAGLHLQFDVSLHIRTVTKCVEKAGPGDPLRDECHTTGLKDSLSRAYRLRELTRWLGRKEWLCFSSLLGELHDQKQRRAVARQGLGTGDAGSCQHYVPDNPEEREGVRSLTEALDPDKVGSEVPVQDHWTIDHAHAFSRKTMKEQRRCPLTIYLATDNEVLRPIFVELLRPYGYVVYSKGTPTHSSFADNAGAGANVRLQSMADFFLLSKSSVVLLYDRTKSTFSYASALYGNATLIHRGHFRWEMQNATNRCGFFVERFANT